MAEKNAAFANLSTNIQFKMTVDEEKKTVTVGRINPSATAADLAAIAEAFEPLFVSTPTQNLRNSKDEIEA